MLRGPFDAAERRDRYRKYVADFRYPHVVERDFGILVLLDSMQGELDDWAHADKRAQGRLGPEQLVSLREIVEGYQPERTSKNKRIVVCLHHSPLHNPRNDAGGCLEDADDFLSIVRGKVDVLLFGHTTPDGLLQQDFPSDQVQLQIPILNCENLEHGAWSPETPVGGLARFTTAAQGHDGRTMVFYIGLDSRVYCKARSPADGGFTNEEAIGDGASQLCVAQNLDGTLEVVYVGNDACLYGVKQLAPDGAWGKPGPIDGRSMTGPPGAIPDAAQVICAARNTDGSLEVFYVGDGLNLFHIRQINANGPFGSGSRLAGPTTHICVGQNTDGRLELFSVGLDKLIYHQWQETAGEGCPRRSAWGGSPRPSASRGTCRVSSNRLRRHELLSLPQSPG